MKYLFWAAFVLLLDLSMSQDVEVPCKDKIDCQFLSNSPPNVTCHEGYCKCLDGNRVPQNCGPQMNITSLPETHLARGVLIGHVCSIDKDCDITDVNAQCNTSRKQCACKPEYVPSSDNQKCLPGIQYNNSGCEIAKQCLHSMANTTCSNGTCLCDVNYHYASGACWESKGFGSNCSVTTECSHIEEAVCNDQYKCACPISRVINPAATACLPVASKLDDQCIESIQCTGILGEKGSCVEGRCRCHEHFHYSANSSGCIPNLDIGANCTADAECSSGEDGSVHGPLRCLANQCTCAEGFKNIEGKCEAILETGDKSSGIRSGDVSAFVMALAYFIILSIAL